MHDTTTHPPGLDRAAYEVRPGAIIEEERPSLFDPLREMVRGVLCYPLNHCWSRQGFGMLRTYFGDAQQYRLNVWHKRFARPGVSTIHDHPWDFDSWIIAGSLTNLRYEATNGYPNHCFQNIKTGEGGGPVDAKIGRIQLLAKQPEFYEAGDSYRQKANEIHETFYADGTVTLNKRSKRFSENARVFWPVGRQWIDAEPRPATDQEVMFVTRAALREWL